MEVIEIKNNELDDIIKNNNKVIVDCYAPWCGPCKMISPIMDELAQEVDDTMFIKINIDENEEVLEKYNIMSIPTILYFKDSELKEQIVGFKTKDELLNIIK